MLRSGTDLLSPLAAMLTLQYLPASSAAFLLHDPVTTCNQLAPDHRSSMQDRDVSYLQHVLHSCVLLRLCG